MSFSSQALIKGIVNRALPVPNSDNTNNDVAIRQSTYGEMFTMPVVRKQHTLADEGSYYVCNNAQTAIVPTYGTSLVATSPFIVISNGATASTSGGPRLYLDYIALTAIVAGASTTTAGYTALAVYIDNILRYTSGGTNLSTTVYNANMASGLNNSSASIYCGAIVAPAASGAVRPICGLRNIRPAVSATVVNVVGDMHLLTFGSVEGAVGSITIANANLMPQALPPVVLGPGHSALIYVWYPVMTAPSAATYAPEIGFWVR
jgi:hypothetical protein